MRSTLHLLSVMQITHHRPFNFPLPLWQWLAPAGSCVLYQNYATQSWSANLVQSKVYLY